VRQPRNIKLQALDAERILILATIDETNGNAARAPILVDGRG